MQTNDGKSNLAIGFFTVIDCPEQGLFGGYLVLNQLSRPLEFHCTTPIKPTRAQQILYGPTLKPYLYGEQIGRVLAASAKTRPAAVFTDREPALALREFVDVPVVLVPEPENRPLEGGATDSIYRIDAAHPSPSRLTEFPLGPHRLMIPSWATADREAVGAALGGIADTFDFREPFERIREAIEEARRGG
jgi:hypothetical protein